MASRTAAPASVNWQEILTACLPRLTLFDVARICVSSKAASQLLRQHLMCGQREVARNLLHGAVQSASACSHNPPVPQHAASVRWLLNSARIPAELFFEDSQQFISVSNVPLDICKQLLSAGVRVTNEQLLSAVRNHVDRPHNWVLAYRSLGVATGLPLMAEAVCCSDFAALTADALKDIGSAEVHNLLSLAIATIGCGETPAEHFAIKQTAKALLAAPAAKELKQLGPQLLQLAVDTLSKRAAQTDTDALYGVDAFCKLSSLWRRAGFSSKDAYQLMKAAITQRLHRSYLNFLLRYKHVMIHLTADMVADLLKLQLQIVAADQDSLFMVVGHLCSRSHAIPADRCMEIFHTAMETLLPKPGLHNDIVALLASLSGLQKASADQILSELNHVLDVSTQHQVADGQAAMAVSHLCNLPRARKIAATFLDKLISRAEGVWGESALILEHLARLLRNTLSRPANSTDAVIIQLL